MSRLPSQPETPAAGAEQPADSDGAEILKTAATTKRNKQLVKAGVAVGIGSAAIVAALLYANRAKRDK